MARIESSQKSVIYRVGVLGGTFDPVHYGHLMLAEEALATVPLDRVLLVPAGQPPHKLEETHSPPEHRVHMLQSAIADNPRLEISRVDLERPGPHYSADMVEILKTQLPAGTEIYFLMGMDSLQHILSWHEPARLLEHCRLVVARRPGYAADIFHLIAELPALEGRLMFLDMPAIEISGADLRRRVAAGRPIRYQVPESVRLYIHMHGLYR